MNLRFLKTDAWIWSFSYYKRYVYENVADFDSINDLALLSHLYTNTVLSMATYVNEYTVDMLPDKPLIENTPNMWSWWPKPISPKYTTEFTAKIRCTIAAELFPPTVHCFSLMPAS